MMISFDNKLINMPENDIDKNDYIEVKKHIKSEEFKKVFCYVHPCTLDAGSCSMLEQ